MGFQVYYFYPWPLAEELPETPTVELCEF